MINNTIPIEKSILVSVLESNFVGTDSWAYTVDLNQDVFVDPFHRKIVSGINRLKNLDLPIDTDILRNKFIEAEKWTITEDDRLIDIISHSPFGTHEMFDKYYRTLTKNIARRVTI